MTDDIIYVAIVEDDADIRRTLSLIIDSSNGFRCQHAFEDGESALEAIPKLHVDVILMDIDLPGISGIEVVKQAKKLRPNIDFIMLTVKSDDDSIFNSLCFGATGYLLKDMDPVGLLDQLKEVHTGGAPMSSQVARRIIKSFQIIENPLSDRESQVLKMLSTGMNYKSIATEIFLSPHTVKTHIKNIYSKLHVNSRAEAVYKAIKQKIL